MLDRKLFLYSIGVSILASALFAWLLEPFSRWILEAATDSAAGWRIWLQNRVFQTPPVAVEHLRVTLFLR